MSSSQASPDAIDQSDLLGVLQAIYCFTIVPIGRDALVRVLSHNMQPLLQLISPAGGLLLVTTISRNKSLPASPSFTLFFLWVYNSTTTASPTASPTPIALPTPLYHLPSTSSLFTPPHPLLHTTNTHHIIHPQINASILSLLRVLFSQNNNNNHR